ncbi:MAG: energy-coupling factor transporter transmembrane protein EcfT [Lachnospiraceae bacterium]|nr:energy-coupling factor transporter transmembrane protein EcfT [Lachnospiraceae bacterium]MBQ8233721.1 energy-coupling factor transporter transmembrane protein EcfT [Lachnospiraceae bacterium]
MQAVISFKESGGRATLDPRTSILSIFVISMVMIGGGLSGVEYWLRLFCCLIPFVFLVTVHNYQFAAIYLGLYLFSAVIEGAVIQLTSGGWNLLFVIVAGIISRFLAPMVMGYCVMQSTTVSEFVTAMERIHVPQVITIPLSVMFRFFPTISEENKAVSEAMRMRQISGKKQSLIKKMEYELVPVMMSTVRIADELSQASLTKGLGGDIKRTHICEVGLRIRDYVLMLFLLVVTVLFVVY